MTISIRQMRQTASGSYDAIEMAHDMLNGETAQPIADVLDWLYDEGYRGETGYMGWGVVMRHSETGELIAVSEI